MSQPEISRRCLSCGASVRAGARFCPQCGEAMKDDGQQAAASENQTTDVTGRGAAPEAPSRREVATAFESWKEEARQTPPASSSSTSASATSSSTTSALSSSSAARREGVDESAGISNVSATAEGGAVVGVEAKRRRAGAVVKENIMPRVERMREEALVVLEETPDDAGLRFVAAAVVLFLLFLLFLFLSTVLK